MNPFTSLRDRILGPSPDEVRAAMNAEYDRQQRAHARRLAAPARKARRRAVQVSRRANRRTA